MSSHILRHVRHSRLPWSSLTSECLVTVSSGPAEAVPVPVVPCKAIEIGEARRAVVIVEALTRENYAYFTDLECTKETMQPAPAGKAHLGRVAEGAASEAASSARSINRVSIKGKQYAM